MSHKSLNRLLCAALVDTNFRTGLLNDPAKAVSTGYLYHVFHLSADENEFIDGVKARSLEDFASQVSVFISNNDDPSRQIPDSVSLAELEWPRHAPLFELNSRQSICRS